MRLLIAAQALPADVTVDVLPLGAGSSLVPEFVSLPFSEYLDGWRLALYVDERSRFDAAADKQIVTYLWTGILVISTSMVVAVMIAGAIRRQLKLASLKNDLVASVSHELEIPLTSMRMRVDTRLTDGQVHDTNGVED